MGEQVELGLAAIQIAKIFNSYIITTVGNEEKVYFVKIRC